MKFKQEFKKKKIEYRYNKATKTLEEVGEIDLQAEVNSNMQPTIDELFDKLLLTNEQKKEQKQIKARREYEEKTDIAQRALDEFNNAKKTVGLDESATVEDFNAVIRNRREQLSKQIESYHRKTDNGKEKEIEKEVDKEIE